MKRAARVCATATLVLAGSCGGDGVLLDPGSEIPDAPTFSSLQSSILTPRCAIPGCHAGADAQQGLRLEEETAYAHLVGVRSTELPEFERVAPGNSADSYMVMKLSGDPRIAGERMPAGGPYLTLSEIDEIREWIDAGARDD